MVNFHRIFAIVPGDVERVRIVRDGSENGGLHHEARLELQRGSDGSRDSPAPGAAGARPCAPQDSAAAGSGFGEDSRIASGDAAADPCGTELHVRGGQGRTDREIAEAGVWAGVGLLIAGLTFWIWLLLNYTAAWWVTLGFAAGFMLAALLYAGEPSGHDYAMAEGKEAGRDRQQ